MKMINRIILNALGKFVDPDRSEDLKIKAIEDPDYNFRTAILFSEVVMYEEYIPNPEFPYYQYKGPITKVCMNYYDRMCQISFDDFDSKYQEAMKFTLIPKIS